MNNLSLIVLILDLEAVILHLVFSLHLLLTFYGLVCLNHLNIFLECFLVILFGYCSLVRIIHLLLGMGAMIYIHFTYNVHI